MSYHVKGNLFLTGDEWSSTQRKDDRGRPTARVWYFDFLNGVQKDDDTTLLINIWGAIARSLCVRHPGNFPVADQGSNPKSDTNECIWLDINN